MPHDFEESLAFSHTASDLPFWREVYEKAFLGMVAMVDHRKDGDHQRAGIDRSVILENSKQILIDEKVRRRNQKTGIVYEDIALEYLSDEARRVPGWVCKPLLADYIAYAIAPLGRCYLLPVIQLQKAWVTHGKQWQGNCQHQIKALNESNGRKWVTVSIGVPVSEVFKAIGEGLRVHFAPYDDTPKPIPTISPGAQANIPISTFDQLLQSDPGLPF